MSMIKLNVCYLIDTDKIKIPWNQVYWSEWASKPQYINPNYIIAMEECTEFNGPGKEYICNEPNFNSRLQINAIKELEYIYVKETPDKIMKLINKECSRDKVKDIISTDDYMKFYENVEESKNGYRKL